MPIETNKTAGDDVDSRCLKCKAVTNHTIIAVAGETIAKVQCNTCGARHNYRAPVAEKKKSSATLRRRGDTGAVTVSGSAKAKTTMAPKKRVSRGAVNFDALIIGKDVSAAIPYRLDAALSVSDLIQHTIFGLGVVMEIILPNKVQVTFQEHGSKLLVCNHVTR
jgi:hypothetical protein